MRELHIGYFKKAVLNAGVLLAIGCSTPAWAQQPSGVEQPYPPVNVESTVLEYRQFEKVEITGSSIVRKEQTLALPVQVMTRTDIKNSGVKALPELLQKLPVMFGVSEPGQLGLTKGSYSSSAIHGMATGTLLLVNGKRQALYGRQNISGDERSSTDLDFLPLSAVERVELLTDGASSLYGTDAIAGVINVITRNERQGFEVTTNIRLPDGMKGTSQSVDLSIGQGLLTRDGYSWAASLEVESREQLMGADRPYASEGRQYFEHQGKSYFVDGSSLTAFQSGSPTLGAGLGATYGGHLWNASYQGGRCPDRQVPAMGQPACLYNPYPEFGLYPKTDIKRFYSKGSLYIGGSTVIFAEVGYSEKNQYKNYSVWPTTYGVIGASASSPGNGLALANGFTPGRTYVMYRPTELGTLARQYEDSNHRIVLGLKGEWDDWNYSANLYQTQSNSSYGFDYASYSNANVLTTDSRLYSLSSSNAATQTLYQTLMSKKSFQKVENGKVQLQVLDFNASRMLFDIDGEPVMLGFGAEWRRHHDQFEGNYLGAINQPNFNAQRHVFAHYVEMQWPVLPKLEVITALRNDRYSDFGSTTHGKISTKWLVSDAWMLRGSLGTGFRAPTVAQIQKTELFSPSFLSVSCNAQLTQLALQLSPQGVCINDAHFPIYTAGSNQLKPELSKQFNWGFQFKPTMQHIWSMDYWRIDMKNTLRQFPSALVLSDPIQYAQYYTLVNNQLVMNLPTVNLGNSTKSGVDFSWAYRQPTEWGRFYAQVQGTRFLKSAQNIAPQLGWTSDLGAYSADSGSVTPTMRTQWTAGLLNGDWNAQVSVNHVTGYTDADVSARDAQTFELATVKGRRVPAFWTLDLNANYQITRTTLLEAKVFNLLNKQAPLSFTQTSSVLNAYNTTYSNFWGRVIQLSLNMKF
jgi:iron complex outermembrane receptor protein